MSGTLYVGTFKVDKPTFTIQDYDTGTVAELYLGAGPFIQYADADDLSELIAAAMDARAQLAEAQAAGGHETRAEVIGVVRGSDAQPDPYIDTIAAEHGSEYEPEDDLPPLPHRVPAAHVPFPEFDGCSCGAEGFTAVLNCGDRTWAHGPARIGSYITCSSPLGGGGCQAQRKVITCEPGLPPEWRPDRDAQPPLRFPAADDEGNTPAESRQPADDLPPLPKRIPGGPPEPGDLEPDERLDHAGEPDPVPPWQAAMNAELSEQALAGSVPLVSLAPEQEEEAEE